jgi:hypothetical protein
MIYRALLLTLILSACSQKAPQTTAPSPPYEAHCKEPLPVFTLGERSNPTKDQEAALCACIWRTLGDWERRTAEQMTEGKESEISWLDKTAFPARFGKAVEKCGGMNL